MTLPLIADYRLPSSEELPPARVSWRPDPARAALLIHDVQEYFLRAFAAGHSALAVVLGNIAVLRARARARGIPVFFTAQQGGQDPQERGLQRDFWGNGMPNDGVAPRIAAAVAPDDGDTILPKWRYSAFHRNDLESILRAGARDQLVVTGVYTHIGCLLTTADAFMRDVQPFLVADATADFSREHHLQALRHAAGCCGVVTTTGAVLEAW